MVAFLREAPWKDDQCRGFAFNGAAPARAPECAANYAEAAHDAPHNFSGAAPARAKMPPLVYLNNKSYGQNFNGAAPARAE